MTIRVGINGFGRIGRNFFRAVAAQKALGGAADIQCFIFRLAGARLSPGAPRRPSGRPRAISS